MGTNQFLIPSAGRRDRTPWWALLALLLLPLSAQAQTQAPPERALVLPVKAASALIPPDVLAMITGELTQRLSNLAGWKMVGPAELEAMLQAESLRQQVGCADAGCLAELAGNLGARWVVVGDVAVVGAWVDWTASLVDQQTQRVVQRSAVRARRPLGLVAKAADLAARLLGREGALDGTPEQVQRRLGFRNREDFQAFLAYQRQHEDLPLEDALTRFILDHNQESRRLALAETVLFGAAAGMLLPVLAAGLATYVTNGLTLSGVALVTLGAGALAAVVAAGLGSAGLVLAVVDALDLGRVEVDANGCCRRDEELRRAERTDPFTANAALAVVLSGLATLPAGMLALGTALSLNFLAAVLVSKEVGLVRVPATPLAVSGAMLCLACCSSPFLQAVAAAPFLVSTPTGLLLWLRPGKPLLAAPNSRNEDEVDP